MYKLWKTATALLGVPSCGIGQDGMATMSVLVLDMFVIWFSHKLKQNTFGTLPKPGWRTPINRQTVNNTIV